MKPLFGTITLLLALPLYGATRYVDSSNTSGTYNGLTWATAWNSLAQITDLSAGDTVYISGGSPGSTKTYSAASWAPVGGSAVGGVITYKIGQADPHNGTAIFNCSGGLWLNNPGSYATISGDALDGQRHFRLSNATKLADLSLRRNVTISYVYAENLNARPYTAHACDYMQLDHCYIHCVKMPAGQNSGAVFFEYSTLGLQQWDQNIVWANEIVIPRFSGGFGYDAIQSQGDESNPPHHQIHGISVISNYIHSYYAPGEYNASDEHQDYWQFYGNNYIRFAHNLLVDAAGGAPGSVAGSAHGLMYNNVILHTTMDANRSSGAGLWAEQTWGNTYNNFWVVNNTFVNTPVSQGTIVFNRAAAGYVSCGAVNNLIIVHSDPDGIPGSGITAVSSVYTDRNVTYQTGPFTEWFTGYVPIGFGLPDMNVTESGAGALGVGTNLYGMPGLAAYMTYLGKDANGNDRPLTGAWTVGAYQYETGGAEFPVISLSASTIDFGLIPTNTTADRTITVANVGTADMTGTASVGAPWSIVSGGSYTLGPGESQVVTLRYTPTAIASHSGNLSFAGDCTASANLTGKAYPMMPSLTFQSTDGLILAPLVNMGTYIRRDCPDGVACYLQCGY